MKPNAEVVKENPNVPKENIMDIFIRGQRKGWNMGINSMIPNIMMAFIIIQTMNITGAMAIIGKVFSPLMGLVGLPGEAAAGLVFGWMSMAGGVGAIVGLFESGLLTPTQVTIIAPAIMLMGAQVQYMGRMLGTSGVPQKYYGLCLGISIVNAFLAMIVMNFIA